LIAVSKRMISVWCWSLLWQHGGVKRAYDIGCFLDLSYVCLLKRTELSKSSTLTRTIRTDRSNVRFTNMKRAGKVCFWFRRIRAVSYQLLRWTTWCHKAQRWLWAVKRPQVAARR